MQTVQNILRVYHQASSGEMDAGLRWYLAAHEEVDRIRKHLSMEVASAIVAAISPGLRWENTIEAAERIIAGETLEGLGIRWYDGVLKAKAILNGRDWADVLRGNKVLRFQHNLWTPTISRSVTVDGHAWAIWYGKRVSLDEVPALSDRLYHRIEDDYVSASLIVGILPSQLQAITWITWRRLHGVSSSAYLPLFEDIDNGD